MIQEARVLLAMLPGEDRAIIAAACDRTIWEHSDETLWQDIQDQWPEEYEWREVWVQIDAEDLAGAFAAITTTGAVKG